MKFSSGIPILMLFFCILASIVSCRPHTRLARSSLAVHATPPVVFFPRQGAEQLPDDAIANAVRDELEKDPLVPATRIEVLSNSGVVSLSGMVDNLMVKERARRVAQTVRGVQSVVNNLEVEPEKRSDADIKRDISRRLSANPALRERDLGIAVQDAGVTLSGNVHSWPERILAEKVTKSVKGVRNIRNDLSVTWAAKRTDGEIRNDIVQALKWDALVERNRIQVKVTDGRVTLAGTVGSAAERARAIELSLVHGVRSVDSSGLEVALLGPGARFHKAPVSDAEMRNALETALRVDPRTSKFGMHITVQDGVVSLNGVVETVAAKRAAEEDARHTTGVVEVKNELKVNPGGALRDSDLAAAVREELSSDPLLRTGTIHVVVSGGIAYLTGTLDSTHERLYAALDASKVKGIVDVVNDVAVRHPAPYVHNPYLDDYFLYELVPGAQWQGTVADEKLREAIRGQMFWSPFVDADRVKVTVDGSTAILSGTVESGHEKEMAAKNAFDAGAGSVINRLEVKRD